MSYLLSNQAENFSNTGELVKNKLEKDNSQSQNSGGLSAARKEYEYNYTYIPSVAMVDKLPPQEQPSKAWFFLLVKPVKDILINILMIKAGNSDNKSLEKEIKSFISTVIFKGVKNLEIDIISKIPQLLILYFFGEIFKNDKRLEEAVFSLLKSKGLSIFDDAIEYILQHLFQGLPTGHVTNLEDYKKLFMEIKLPDVAYNFQEDEKFAYMQVGGYNPLMIERVNSDDNLENKFSLTEAQYQEIMGNDDSLGLALEEGRLYIADYGALEGAPNGTFPKEQKYIYAPMALFAVPKAIEECSEVCDSSRLMRSVAIQCTQNPEDKLTFTPKSNEYAWLCAKSIVEVANSNFHEALSHLGRTHLFIGRFVIATHRQLADDHCLSLLLLPHFEGTLNINDAAQKFLVAPGGGVDQLLASTIDGARALVEADLQNYSFNEAMLPKQLEKRGVDDKEKLPIYPYRDDALLVWDAIHQWVSDYLNIHYQSNEDVQNDRKLQNWAAEVVAYDGARVTDFGQKDGNGDIKILTLDYLIDAITLIIFTASAQHAAVNFPQKDIMSYAPAVPLAGYQPVSTLQNEVTEQDYFNLLPPLEQALGQLNLTYLLGSVHYTILGKYPENHFNDSSVKDALKTFQQNLSDVEGKIIQRNEKGFNYNYLLPSQIPQSINI